MSSPWVRRALAGTLPAKDLTGYAHDVPSADELLGEPGALTVVDVRTGEVFRLSRPADLARLEEPADMKAASWVESLE